MPTARAALLPRGPGVYRLACFLLLLPVPACEDNHFAEAVSLPWAPPGPRPHTEEGEVMLADGNQAEVSYQAPFVAPPRLALVSFSQAWSRDKPYSLADFQILQQGADGFVLQNGHHEPGSWAVVKWRAVGMRAGPKPDSAKTRSELIASRVEKAGGKVVVARHLPDKAILAIDLHGTAATDADLELFEGLAMLRSLNLYGTKITDAGLVHLAGLTSLQTLHLNSTAVGDEGLLHLRGLVGLKELGLYQTRVTDAGLIHLQGLANLEDLSLGGPGITDRGLVHLKGLRNLKRLFVGGTAVTPAGVQDLQRTLPGVRVVR